MTKEKMNIFEKIMTARLEFLNSNPTKSGYNKFQNFKYFELVDIVPVATKICKELGLYTHININEGKAVMTVVNMENVHEQLDFKIDAPMVRENDFNKMLQDVGRSETYIRRYLYMLFLDIVENDTVDAADQNKPKNDFRTAAQYKKRTPVKSRARLEAEKIVEGLEDKTLENARLKLIEVCGERKLPAKQCEGIWQELEVLLNGTDGKANS